MGPVTALSLYLVIWWVVFLAVLPMGTQSYHEAGVKPPPGADPGAPMEPKLKNKFWLASGIAAVLMAILYAVVEFNLISLPPVAQTY